MNTENQPLLRAAARIAVSKNPGGCAQIRHAVEAGPVKWLRERFLSGSFALGTFKLEVELEGTDSAALTAAIETMRGLAKVEAFDIGQNPKLSRASAPKPPAAREAGRFSRGRFAARR